MKYLLLSFLFVSIIGNSQTTDLLISEYGEGSGGNKKYIEIYNGTGADIDLSSYQIWISANSSPWSGNIQLSGTLIDGETYVIANNSTDTPGADLYDSYISINGDDAIAIAKDAGSGYAPIDIIGVDAEDPGTGWPVAGIVNATKDMILIRKPTVCSPTTDWVLSAGTNTTDSQWIIAVNPYNNTNQTTDLGTHTANCSVSCATTSTITISECVSYTSPSGNYTWTTSDTYKDTIPNAAMCDSVITINLTINQPETVSATASICTGQTYTFGTQTLTDADAGLHTEIFPNVNNCDSTVNLTLTVVAGYNETATATICEGETYVFGSQNLTTSGPYMETFTSVGLCDSIVNLTLTVIPRTYNTITVTECNSYTSPSGNYTWTTSNTYNDTIQNAANCDSVITINLTINNPTSASISESVCGSYDFLGNTLTTSGIYVDTIPNAANCDSIITLTLDVTQVPGAPTVSSNASYCENETLDDMTATGMEFGELIIAGVADGTLPNGLPKVVEFYAIQDIADLSIYGFGSANNGGGTDGEEFTFPAIALTAGDHYYVSLDSTNFNDFFGFYPNYSEGTASNINGDDAIELFKNGVVVDVFGDINVDGTNTPWDYLDGWAYRNNNSLPNGGVFNIAEWTFSGVNGLENGTTNATSDVPYPNGTLTVTLPTSTITWYSDATLMNSIGTGETQTPSNTIGATDYYVTETITGGTSCEGSASTVTITINANPTVTFSTLSDICENASDYTLVEGAPAGGTYSGNGVTSGVFSPSTAGVGTETLTYTFTDGNNCTASATQSITINAAPNVTFSAISDVCENASDYTLVEGAPAGGTYSGNGVSAGVFSPTTAGVGTETLTYTYSNANCTASATQTITVNANPSVTFSTLSDICENASDYTLVEGAPAGGTYSGNGVTSGVFSPSTAGVGTETLTYTFTDGNNCTANATQTITVHATPTVTFGNLSTVCVYNPSMTLTGGSPAGGTYSGPGVTAGSFDPSTAGIGTHTISYSYTDGNGCEGSATSSITVDGCASIDENNSIGLSIFPNPTNGLITILFEGNSANINIVDITGKAINQSKIQSNESIDLSTLNAGTYFISVEIDGKSSTERVIVK